MSKTFVFDTGYFQIRCLRGVSSFFAKILWGILQFIQFNKVWSVISLSNPFIWILSTFIALDYYSCCWLLVMFIYWWWLFLLMIQRHLGAHLYTNVKQWNLHVFSSGCLSPYNAFSITSLRGRRLYLWYKFQKPKVSF